MTKEQAEYVKSLRCVGCTYRAIAKHYARKYPGSSEIGDNQIDGQWLVSEAAQILDESDLAWDDAGVANVGYDAEKVMTDEDILRQLTREIMGPSVAHMNDKQLDAWSQRIMLRDVIDSMPEFPAWFIIRRDKARSKLLAVLRARLAGCGGGPS